MGTNSSRVTSNYELKISEAPAVKLAAPVVKPQNGRRHSAGAAIHPSSPEKPVPGPTAPTASRTDGFYSPVKQASTTKLGVPPRTSSMNDLLRRQSSIKQETYSTKFVAQTVCSPTVPWIVKKAKFIHLPPSAIEFGRVIGRS